MGRGHPAGEGEPESQRRRPQSSPALLRGGGVGVDAADGARRRATPERTGDLSGGSRLRRSARGAGSRAVAAVALRLDPCRRRGERGDGCFDERARQRRRAAMGRPVMSSFHAAFSLGGAVAPFLAHGSPRPRPPLAFGAPASSAWPSSRSPPAPCGTTAGGSAAAPSSSPDKTCFRWPAWRCCR